MNEQLSQALNRAELPLVLMAAVAHPEEPFRVDLNRRLRATIKLRRPMYAMEDLRAFFRRQDGRGRGAFGLCPPMRELAVLVARIAFSTLPRVPRCAALQISPGDGAGQAGYVMTRDLVVASPERCALTWRHLQDLGAGAGPLVRFLPEIAADRLGAFARQEPRVHASCRVADRLLLEVLDEDVPASSIVLLRAGARTRPAAPEQLGFRQQCLGNTVRLWPDTPEATLRFTAWLNEGRQLVLEHRDEGISNGRTVAIWLRDFDGQQIDLLAKASVNQAEPWLIGCPTLGMDLTPDDHLALARWAYPLNEWMSEDLLENLA
jgi:hypothetical protein